MALIVSTSVATVVVVGVGLINRRNVMGYGPTCCIGDCCGPGSYCCGHPDNIHTHQLQLGSKMFSSNNIINQRYFIVKPDLSYQPLDFLWLSVLEIHGGVRASGRSTDEAVPDVKVDLLSSDGLIKVSATAWWEDHTTQYRRWFTEAISTDEVLTEVLNCLLAPAFIGRFVESGSDHVQGRLL